MLYGEDPVADDISVANTLDQGLSILAKMPAILCYSMAAKAHFFENKSLIVHPDIDFWLLIFGTIIVFVLNLLFMKRKDFLN